MDILLGDFSDAMCLLASIKRLASSSFSGLARVFFNWSSKASDFIPKVYHTAAQDFMELHVWAEKVTGIKQLCLHCGEEFSIADDHACFRAVKGVHTQTMNQISKWREEGMPEHLESRMTWQKHYEQKIRAVKELLNEIEEDDQGG